MTLAELLEICEGKNPEEVEIHYFENNLCYATVVYDTDTVDGTFYVDLKRGAPE